MNFNQLEWFCAAYRTHSFAKAAEQTYVSRQAFGKAIKALEDELGVELFVRDESGAHPTEAADDIFPFAWRCLKNMQAIRQTAAMADGRRPVITIAIADGVLESLPDGFFETMEKDIPWVEIHVEKHFYMRCTELLEAGRVEFAIVPGPLKTEGAERVALADEPVYLVFSRSMLDVEPESFRIDQLRGSTVFAVGKGDLSDLGLSELAARCGVDVCTNRQYNDYELILSKVRAGQGVCMAPESVRRRIDGGDLVFVPSPDPGLRWRIDFVCIGRSCTEAERAVMDYIRGYADSKE